MYFLQLPQQGIQQTVGHSLPASSFLMLLLGLTVVMHITPGTLADIAEMVTTGTYHMIPSLFFLNEHEAIGTSLPIFEMLLKIILTWTFVRGEQTLLTKFYVALRTLEAVFFRVDDSVAAFGGTELQIGIAGCLLP